LIIEQLIKLLSLHRS